MYEEKPEIVEEPAQEEIVQKEVVEKEEPKVDAESPEAFNNQEENPNE